MSNFSRLKANEGNQKQTVGGHKKTDEESTDDKIKSQAQPSEDKTTPSVRRVQPNKTAKQKSSVVSKPAQSSSQNPDIRSSEGRASDSDQELHNWEEDELKKKMRFSRRMLTPHRSQSQSREMPEEKRNGCCRCLQCFFLCLTTGCYVFCLPIPSHVTRKLAFHPPQRGKFYRLSYIGENGKEIEVDSAKKAFGQRTIKFEPKVDNKEMEYFTKLAVLNSETFVVKTKPKNYLVGLWLKYPASNNTVVLFAQANAVDLGMFAQMDINFRDISDSLKIDVYSFDYSGYGRSSGKPSEYNLYQDIRAVYEHICKTRPNAKVVLIGYSMGTAACVDLASHLALKHPNQLVGLVLMAPFTSGCRLLRSKPESNHSCCCDPFRSVDKVKLIDVPTLLVHGAEDDMVPITHSMELKKRLRHAVRPLYLKKANHSEILCQKYPEVLSRVRRFIEHEIANPV